MERLNNLNVIEILGLLKLAFLNEEAKELENILCNYMYIKYLVNLGKETINDEKVEKVENCWDGLNWYSYCGGNPVNMIDPLGLSLECDRESPDSLSNSGKRARNRASKDPDPDPNDYTADPRWGGKSSSDFEHYMRSKNGKVTDADIDFYNNAVSFYANNAVNLAISKMFTSLFQEDAVMNNLQTHMPEVPENKTHAPIFASSRLEGVTLVANVNVSDLGTVIKGMYRQGIENSAQVSPLLGMFYSMNSVQGIIDSVLGPGPGDNVSLYNEARSMTRGAFNGFFTGYMMYSGYELGAGLYYAANKAISWVSGFFSNITKAGVRVGEYLATKAPNQVTPGIKALIGQYIDDLGRVQAWTANYDKYGRLIARTDFNAGNLKQGIPKIHHHTYEWGAGKTPLETGSHLPGEYKP